MNPWLVLTAIALLALFYVLVPVGLAMAVRFRGPRIAHCPVTAEGASLTIARAGLGEALGRRSLRRVRDCSLWPRQASVCRRECLELPDDALTEVRTAL